MVEFHGELYDFEKLQMSPVLEHGDAALAGVDRDEELALGLRERGALGRCPAALRRGALAALRIALGAFLLLAFLPFGRLALPLSGCGLCDGLCRSLAGGAVRGSTTAGRPLASASSAGTAAALRCCCCRVARVHGGRCVDYRMRLGLDDGGRGSLLRRLLSALLASEPREWQTRLLVL